MIELGFADRGCSLKCATACEHTKTNKYPPLALVEELETPVDRRLQGLLALRKVARPPDEKWQPPLEPAEELIGRERLDAHRCEFHGERQTIKAAADSLDRAALRRQQKTRLDGSRTFVEESDGAVLG